jgi:hypothetical protein
MSDIKGVAGFHCVKPKLIYQHKDAEPEKLGVRILNELRQYEPFEFDYIEEKVHELVAVPEYGGVELKRRQELIRQMPEYMVNHSAISNYELFSPLQGTLEPWMTGRVDFYPNGTDFVHDSYFCKWGFVANMDTRHLDVLRGDQIEEPINNLYGLYADKFNASGLAPAATIHTGPFGEYFPCRIVESYPFDELPSDSRFLSDLRVYRDNPLSGLDAAPAPLHITDYQI